MGLIQTLITKFLLDPKGYQDGAKVVEDATRRVTGVIERAKTGIMSSLGAMFDPTRWLAGIGVGVGLLSTFVGYTANAAIGFDTINRSLVAVTKSGERAKAILAFDDKLAGPSIFSSQELAQASLTLEAFKLATESYLPVAEKLGTVFGGNAEALNEFVAALGYLKNGRFGEGFESLTRAGLSREDFEGKGLTFDKGGSYQGDADEALKAVSELVNERFGRLSEEMANGPAAKLASVMDAIGRAARVAGFAVLTVLMPAAERLGNFIAWLVDSGVIENAFNGIAKLFSGKDIGDGLVHAVAWLVATLNHVPGIVHAIGTIFEGLFTWLRENLLTIGRVFVAIWAFDAVFKGMMMIHGAIKALQVAEEGLAVAAAIRTAIETKGAAVLLTASIAALAATAAVAAFDAAMAKMSITSIPGMAGLSGVFGAIERDQSMYVTQFTGQAAKGPTGAAGSILDGLQNALSPTKQIAEHTKRTAAATEKMASVSDQVLGGSTVGKGATSGVNIDKALGRSGGSGGNKLEQAVRLIGEHVMEISGGMIVASEYQRNGGR